MRRLSSCGVALALVVTTCTGDPPAFYNPNSGAIAECTPTDGANDPSLKQCMATYERAGWVPYSGGPVIDREKAPTTSP